MFELGTDGPVRILVAVDGSDTSLRAGACAAGLARRQGAQIICVYMPTLPGLVSLAPSAAGAALSIQEAVADDLRAQIARARGVLHVSIELVTRRGDPFAEIVRLADERKVDAVVVGASTTAGHRLVGSPRGAPGTRRALAGDGRPLRVASTAGLFRRGLLSAR